MNLEQKQIDQIRGGRKTQMRIPVREPELTRRKRRAGGQWVYYGPEYWTQPFTPKDGATLTLRAPSPGNAERRPEPVHITITGFEQTDMSNLTLPDALAEGHKTTDEFRVWWVRRYDKQWVNNHDSDDDALPDAALVDRFDTRHASRPVWAIRFELDRTERPRLLVPTGQSTGADEHGYTDDPALSMPRIADPGEAVGDMWERRFAKEAQEAHEHRARERSLAWRLDQALLQAKAQGIDVDTQILAIERRIRTITNRVNQRKAA